jgi:hypothetical protein
VPRHRQPASHFNRNAKIIRLAVLLYAPNPVRRQTATCATCAAQSRTEGGRDRRELVASRHS